MTAALVGHNFYTAPAISAFVFGAPVTVTRPNNVVAYVANQVYGAAADARLLLPVPAQPAANALPGFSNLFLFITRSRPATDPALTLNAIAGSAAFATVLGDQATVALSDADIALVIPAPGQVGINQISWTSSAGANSVLNAAASPNGRSGAVLAGNPLGGYYWTPGSVACFYLVVNAAYVPTANETLLVVPVFVYAAKITT